MLSSIKAELSIIGVVQHQLKHSRRSKTDTDLNITPLHCSLPEDKALASYIPNLCGYSYIELPLFSAGGIYVHSACKRLHLSPVSFPGNARMVSFA